MKAIQRWVPILGLIFLCGCFQVQDELTLRPDGSGTVMLTLQTSLPDELLEMLGMSSRYGGGGASFYPPSSEWEARRFFPAKDFALKVEQKSADTGKALTIEAKFKDLNRLLASPYGRAHQMILKTNGSGALTLQALSGGSILAQAAQAKPEETGRVATDFPGMDEAQKKKGEMRFLFRVTMPNAVTAANGAREGSTVTWAVERAQCKDDEEFAAKLSPVLEASCSAAGLKFNPKGPVRMGLLPFGQLGAGAIAATTALPDTNKIVAAARFVPCVLHVSRSLDLSGEGAGQPSEARLTGAVLLPEELAPQRWGQPRLDEVVDAGGKSLMPKEDADSMMSRMVRYESFGRENVDGQEADDEKNETGPKPHILTLSFKAPEWKVKRIAKIRGMLDLQYLGASEIIKLSNAVPAALVLDMSKGSGSSYGVESERGQVTDPRLRELGFALRVQMAMVQSGMTMLSLETGGGNAALVDAQVFDVDGKPWPTTMIQAEGAGGEERGAQLVVAGKPKPPFSLALELGGVGASVGVPIVLENVPLGDK